MRQLPVPTSQVLSLNEAIQKFGGQDGWYGNGFTFFEGKLFVLLDFLKNQIVVEVPKVEMITTRSGCDKTHISVDSDLLLIRLENGIIELDFPHSFDSKVQPSYDTSLMLSQAIGNALIASICEYKKVSLNCLGHIRNNGFALAHWHGYVQKDKIPWDYAFFGESNPPVSCSTHQSAVYALTGKLKAFEEKFKENVDFIGDIQIEPHHGVNITGRSLNYLSRLALSLSS